MYQQPEQEMRVVRDVVAEMKALKEENAKLQKRVEFYKGCFEQAEQERDYEHNRFLIEQVRNADAWDKGYEQGRAKAQVEVNDAQQGETEQKEIIKTLVCSIVASGVMDEGEFNVITNAGWGFTTGERNAFSNILSEMNDDDWNEDDRQTLLGYTNGILELIDNTFVDSDGE